MSSTHDTQLAQAFAEHRGRVARVLRRAGVPERDVQDAQQDVFIVAQRKLGELQQRASMGGWLRGIAVRVASQYRRRARVRHERLALSEQCDPIARATAELPCAASALDLQRAREQLDAALHALSLPQREVFVLHELHELPMQEIATMAAVPLKTAFSRLYAARRLLSVALREKRVLAAGLVWLMTRARAAQAQWLFPKLAVVALSVLCALAEQPQPRPIEPLAPLSVQAPRIPRATQRAIALPTIAIEGRIEAPPRRARARTASASMPVPSAPIAAPARPAPPRPQLDYAIWRAGAYDVKPDLDHPLAPEAISTRIAPRIRTRAPSDPVDGIEIAFAR